MSTSTDHLNASVERSGRDSSFDLQYSIAIIGDCFDDYALLDFLLRRLNLPFDTLKRYDSLADLYESRQSSHDILFVHQPIHRCNGSEDRLRALSATFNGCGVILHSQTQPALANPERAMEGSISVFDQGSLETHVIEAVISAAARVGPRV